MMNWVILFAISTISCEVEVLYKWKNIVYGDNVSFPKENAAMTGIKYYNDKIYVTVPRWKEYVPYTLNVVGTNDLNEPVLFPWPNADIQYLGGECDKIQNVQSMEIDLQGRMWVIDVGRRNIMTNSPINVCPPKFLLISMSDGEVLHRYTFPNTVADYNNSFLNDIVLDVVDEIAYISDAGVGGIVVYDLKKDWSRKYVGRSSASADGIALTPERDKVIFCGMQAATLFSIPTKSLLNSSISDSDLENYVEKLGEKPSTSDGLAMSESGVLYFGGITTNAIYKTPSPYNVERETTVVAQDDEKLLWPDTFAFDDKGHLLVTANNLNLFMRDPNNAAMYFYIVSVDVGEGSYMQGQLTKEKIGGS